MVYILQFITCLFKCYSSVINMNEAKLDLLFFRRTFRIFKILFQKFNSRSAILFYILVFLSLILQFVIYGAGLVPSMFFEVLGGKEWTRFQNLSIYAILLIVLNAVMKSMLNYLSRILYLTWRRRLCSKLHERYFDKMMYYKLNVLDTSLDNMDQRITRDANLFTKEWSILISRLVVIPFTLVYYSYQCFISTTWLGPVIIYVYFIVGTIINRLIMAPIIRLNVEQEVYEGNFRFQHMNVRANSESMAFYRAGEVEHSKSNRKLKKLLEVLTSLYDWSFWLNTAVNIFDYVGGILSYLVIAIPIFAGVYDDLAPEEISALISRNAFVCIYLIFTFSQMIDMSGTVGDIAAHTHRLAQVFESVEEKNKKNLVDQEVETVGSFYDNAMFEDDDKCVIDKSDDDDDEKAIERKEAASKSLKSSTSLAAEKIPTFFNFENVTFSTPDQSTVLVEDLTLSIERGKNILITGPTGCGKTTLLRLIAGLCNPSKGCVKRWVTFGPRGVFFLPQKPVMTDGSLQRQITYPRNTPYPEFDKDENQKRMESIIEEVGLKEFVAKQGGLQQTSNMDWNNKLSIGEMQRLSFARLLHHHPDLAVLDECTSGLNEESEDLFFNLLQKRKITYVTVGHGQNLKQHHDVELRLIGDRRWDFIYFKQPDPTPF